MRKTIQKMLGLFGLIALMTSSPVTAGEIRVQGFNNLDAITKEQITSISTINRYQFNASDGEPGSYIVIGTQVPYTDYIEILQSVTMSGRSWNVVYSNVSNLFSENTNDILVGVVYDEYQLPSTEPVNSKDLSELRNREKVTNRFIESKYKNKLHVSANGGIYRFGITTAEQNTIDTQTAVVSEEIWIQDIKQTSLDVLTDLLRKESVGNYLKMEREDTETDLETIALRIRYIKNILRKM